MRSIAERSTDRHAQPRGCGASSASASSPCRIERGDVIITHALGSCIAVCIYDPMAGVGGMLHFLLPEARINPGAAKQQPAVFADTGIPLLFQAAYERGLKKQRAIVQAGRRRRDGAVGGRRIQDRAAQLARGEESPLA